MTEGYVVINKPHAMPCGLRLEDNAIVLEETKHVAAVYPDYEAARNTIRRTTRKTLRDGVGTWQGEPRKNMLKALRQNYKIMRLA